jgi:hypothetical protein
MNRAQLAWRSAAVLTVGLLLSLIGVGLQLLAPSGSVQQAPLGSRTEVTVGEPGIVNVLGLVLVLLGVAGLASSGVLSLRARQQVATEERSRADHLRTLAAQAEPLLAAGESVEAAHTALVQTGATSHDAQAALQLDWPKGRRCPRCRANLRRFTYTPQPWHVCNGCGWIGLPDSEPKETTR